jgi:hypothetical protein
MKHGLSGRIRQKGFPFILLLVFGCLTGCVTYKPSTVVIERAGTLLDDGKLYVYVDGKQINQNQPIGKGQTRNLPVPNGFHRIRVKVNSLESDEMQFTVENNSVSFKVLTERIGGSKVLLLQHGTG